MPSLMDTYNRSLLTFRFPRQTKAAELVHGMPPFAVRRRPGNTHQAPSARRFRADGACEA